MTKRILVAGIGNIFLGDDAFGVEVVQHLERQVVPASVQVSDFGIRGYDLAYALMDDYDAVILIDAVRRGRPPGTLYVLALETAKGGSGQVLANGHGMHPEQVLRMVEMMGGTAEDVYLVGCEAAVLESPEGRIGLSDPVRDAVPAAADLVLSLVHDLLNDGADALAVRQERGHN